MRDRVVCISTTQHAYAATTDCATVSATEAINNLLIVADTEPVGLPGISPGDTIELSGLVNLYTGIMGAGQYRIHTLHGGRH